LPDMLIVARAASASTATSTTTLTASSMVAVSSQNPGLSTVPSPTAPLSLSFSTGRLPEPTICASKHVFGNVNWMGISGVTGGWQFRLVQAADALSCCNACFESTPEGCDSWAFILGSDGFTATSCNLIYGWPGSNMDKSCPAGHTYVVFSQSADNSGQQGGTGPCGDIV